MKLLLDVHAFVWWDNGRDNLSPAAFTACSSADNTLHLSLASVWEMEIKHQLGKLTLRQPLGDLLRDHEQRNGLRLEPVNCPTSSRSRRCRRIIATPSTASSSCRQSAADTGW